MDSNNDAGWPHMRWADLILSLLRGIECPSVTVHPLDGRGDKPCFAVSVDKKLLCGTDGSIAFFDSLAAVARFLAAIDVQGFSYGEFPDPGMADRMARQCFQLGRQGLTACRECARGGAARPPAAGQHFTWQDEDWSCWDDEEF